MYSAIRTMQFDVMACPLPAYYFLKLHLHMQCDVMACPLPAYYFLKLHLHHFSKIKSQKEQRWASTHANRSNARLRLKTLPSIKRSNRSSFFKKRNDRTLYRDFWPSIIDFYDRKPSISFIWGIKMRRILSPFQI
jgi:hypothetical protein